MKSGSSGRLSKKAEKKLFKLAANISGKKKENLYVVNAKTGETIAHFVGEDKSVRKSREITKLLRRQGRKYAVLHNHPGGKAPSAGDVINSLRNAYAEGWVVTPHGKIWRYWGIGKEPMNSEEVAKVRLFRSIARGIISRKIRKSKVAHTPEKKKGRISQLTMQLLKKGVKLKPMIAYSVSRANPSNPCFSCGPRTYCEVMDNPARPSREVMRGLEEIAEDLYSRLDDSDYPTRVRKVMGDFWVTLDYHYASRGGKSFRLTLRTPSQTRSLFFRNLDDAARAFRWYVNAIRPRPEYMERALRSASESYPRLP